MRIDKKKFIEHLRKQLHSAIREGDIEHAVGYALGIAENEGAKHLGKRAIVVFVEACEQVVE